MPIYTTQELAELSGKKTKTIAAMASPSKRNLVRDENGNFNTEHPKNLAFVQKHDVRSTDVEHEQKQESQPEPKPIAHKKTESKQEPEPQSSAAQMMNVEFITKKLTAEKLREQIKTEQLKRDKVEAKLVRREVVEELFRLHFNNISTAFNDFVKAQAKFIINMRGVKREDSVKFEQSCNENLADKINTAKEITANEIDAYCIEYSKQSKL